MRWTAILALTAILLAGCSTRPREFQPKLTAPAADAAKFDETLLQCQVMVRRGVKGNFGMIAAQLGAGTAGGWAVGLAGVSLASSSANLLTTVNNTIVVGGSALLIVGPLTSFGVSRLIRMSREKKYKTALGNCLTEFGYTAESWEKQKKLSKDQVKAVLDKWQAATPPAVNSLVAKDAEVN